ncbi:MAG: hypothetical protein JW894_13390 [Bacteroidales bacterium]|nr:hypothetical protein [Bacteroidales bacterium]
MTKLNLFKAKWKSSNPQIREEAVKSLKDIAALADIAENDEYPFVRKAAINSLIWPLHSDIITKVAINDDDASVRKSAIEKVKDSVILMYIILKEPDEDNRLTAVENIKSTEILARLGKNNTACDYARQLAVSKIQDEEILGEIANQTSSYIVYSKAIDKIKQKSVLIHIIENSVSYGARNYARNVLINISTCHKCKSSCAIYYCKSCNISICKKCIQEKHSLKFQSELYCPECNKLIDNKLYRNYFEE